MATNNNKFPQNDYLFPPVEDSSRLLVGCTLKDYSASRIARAVEDCDAHLLNLNITKLGGNSTDDDNYPVVFDLRVNQRNTAGISRSLERYGFTVLDVDQENNDDIRDTTRQRIDSLFRYLEI